MSDIINDTCDSVDAYWTEHSKAFPADSLVSADGKYRVNGTLFGDDGYPPNAGRYIYTRHNLEGAISYISADLHLKFQSLESPGTYGISAASLMWGASLDKAIGFGIFQNGDVDKTLVVQIAGPEELEAPIVIYTRAMAPHPGAFTRTISCNIRIQVNGSNLDIYLNGDLIVTVPGGFGGKVGFYLQKNWQPDGGTDNNVSGLIDNIIVDTEEYVPPEEQDDTLLDYLGDIKVLYTNGEFEIQVYKNDLVRDGGLKSAILLSLLTDHRAEKNDKLLDGSSDRRGWWADNKFGSRKWLLSWDKMTDESLAKLAEYDKEALRWMVDEGIAESVEVTAVRDTEDVSSFIESVIIKQPKTDGEKVYRWQFNWNELFREGV